MRTVLFAVTCWATIGLGSSRADVTYRYITDQERYTGNISDLVLVKIFLQEITTAGSTSRIFSDGGLFGAGVRLISPDGAIYGSAPGTHDFKIVPNQTPPPGGFGPNLFSQAPATATEAGLIVNGDVPTANSVFFTDGAPGTRLVLLGVVLVEIGVTPATLMVTPYGGVLNTITQLATDLDFGTQAANGYTGTTNNPLGNYSFTVEGVLGDTNGDQTVDLNDLNNVRNNFGLTGDGIAGDTNADRVVDLIDLNNVRNFFGVTAPQAVPEPSSLALLALGAAGIIARRRKARR